MLGGVAETKDRARAETQDATTVARGLGDTSTVAGARRAARSWLSSNDAGDDVVERTVLIVSELVTNAITHGRSAWALALGWTARGGVLVLVSDSGTGQPAVQAPAGDATSGRGLAVVQALSETWGWHPTGDVAGKVVWAEVVGG